MVTSPTNIRLAELHCQDLLAEAAQQRRVAQAEARVPGRAIHRERGPAPAMVIARYARFLLASLAPVAFAMTVN